MKSLRQILSTALFSGSLLAAGPALAETAEDMLSSDWFQQKCQPQIIQYQADRMVIREMVINDAWASPMTDQLPWPTSFRSRFAKHACVNVDVMYVNQSNPSTENFLCSVLDNDLRTEVKMFGNADLAAEICAEPG